VTQFENYGPSISYGKEVEAMSKNGLKTFGGIALVSLAAMLSGCSKDAEDVAQEAALKV